MNTEKGNHHQSSRRGGPEDPEERRRWRENLSAALRGKPSHNKGNRYTLSQKSKDAMSKSHREFHGTEYTEMQIRKAFDESPNTFNAAKTAIRLGVSRKTVDRVLERMQFSRKDSLRQAVLDRQALGKSTAEIAEELKVSQRTVQRVVAKNSQDR